MKYVLFSLSTLLLISFAVNAQTTQTIKGRIVEQVTKLPLVGVSVVIEGTNIGTVSDQSGYYKIANVPIGRQTLKVSFVGYETQINSNLIVTASKELVLDFELDEHTTSLNEVTVIYNRNKDPRVSNNLTSVISSRSFNVEDTKRYAGSLGDPSRMAANFAGVAANNDSRNDIVVRGNSPLGMLWQLEGLNIPNPNHFGSVYSTGGPISMLNNNVLAKSDFFTSAFPAQYGNGTSGVFDLRLREGNNEKHEFLSQFGYNGFEVGAEGPLSRSNKSSYLINYRYTALGLLKNLGMNIGTNSPPIYQDINLKCTFPLKNNAKINVFALGGISRIDLLGKDIDTSSTTYYGRVNENVYPRFRTGVAGISYEKSLTIKTFAKFVIGVSSSQQLHREDSIALALLDKPSFLKTDAAFSLTKYSFAANMSHKFNTKSSLYFGLNSDLSNADFVRKLFNNGAERVWINFNEQNLLSQAYVTWQYKPGNRFVFNTGIHIQHYSVNDQIVAEPRIGIRCNATDKSSFNIGYGLHHQTQGLFTSYVQDQAGIRTNIDLGFSRSNHFVLGYNYSISENTILKLETYFQYLDKIPVHNYSSSFSMVNEGTNTAPIDQLNLINKGTGRNYGVDLTLERYLNKGFYYLITSSLFNSKYKGSDEILRNTAFNTQYVLNLLSGKEWKLRKEGNVIALNLRFTTVGGRYFTPLNLPASQASGTAVEDNTKAFSEKQKPYLRLDIKVAYRKEFKYSSLEMALDLQNITNNKNIFAKGYNQVNNTISLEYQQGFLPIPTIRFTF
jgi:hypothetical protein